MSSTSANTPAGYRTNAQGHLIPEDKIKPIDQARDALVSEIVARALEERERLRAFKTQAYADIAAFVSLSAEQYRVALGGEKGNVTLLSFDGRYKVIRAMQETIAFDERLQAAKELIDICVADWTNGARAEIVVIVQDAFRVDATGKIRTGSILALRRYDIKDARWLQAMDAISDAVQVVGSKSYIRIYERDVNGKYQPISLDLAGI
ncbi:DUF3164 family protein [Luteibacter aegosomatis]|uniref:DUF3164 family protein n=1 Tax=Luteibacter aegosomatis TaxID=2911537 RepID=UPI001FF74257|nr:DUF3164 family protein [Luteibacter aegosomatis]UPG87002.1 DUF3164 family protein [Luteibacter aegosomatis]